MPSSIIQKFTMVLRVVFTARDISLNGRQSPNRETISESGDNLPIGRHKFRYHGQTSHKFSTLLSHWLRSRPIFGPKNFKEGHIFNKKHQRNHYFKGQRKLVQQKHFGYSSSFIVLTLISRDFVR